MKEVYMSENLWKKLVYVSENIWVKNLWKNCIGVKIYEGTIYEWKFMKDVYMSENLWRNYIWVKIYERSI